LNANLINNNITNLTEPIIFRLGLTRKIEETLFEQDIVESNRVEEDGTVKVHTIVSTYREYACSFLDSDKKWSHSTCTLKFGFGDNFALCECLVMGTIMISEISSETTLQFKTLTGSKNRTDKELPYNCELCDYIPLIVTPFVIILFLTFVGVLLLYRYRKNNARLPSYKVMFINEAETTSTRTDNTSEDDNSVFVFRKKHDPTMANVFTSMQLATYQVSDV